MKALLAAATLVFLSARTAPARRPSGSRRPGTFLAGTLARLQQYGKADQRRALNDALILLSATRAGLTVLTRNLGDYDR